jgi:hypothetical protein
VGKQIASTNRTGMSERIDRSNDENLYQPKIHSERIRVLYQLKQVTGKPMTVLVDQAIREFAASYGIEYHPELEEEPTLEKVDKETWEEICEYRQFLDQLEYQRYLNELEEIKGRDKETMLGMKERESIRGDNEMLNTIYQAK